MNKKTYILLLISIIFVISLGGVIWSGIYKISYLRNEEGSFRGELQSWAKTNKQTSTMQNTLNEAKMVRSSMDEYYLTPTEENQISLISDIEKIIKNSGSTGEVQSIDVAPDYSSVVGSIIILGKWDDIYQTMLALEAYPIKLYFDDTSIVEDKTLTPVSDIKSIPTGKTQNYRASLKFTIKNINKPK